jgi:hypothetical protein
MREVFFRFPKEKEPEKTWRWVYLKENTCECLIHSLFCASMKLSGIDKKSVLKATRIIDQKKLSKTQLESDYQVIVGDRQYPFKLLVDTTYKVANGRKLPSDTFKEYNYLIKQFETFTGFKVTLSLGYVFVKELKKTLIAIESQSILTHEGNGHFLDMTALGPMVNDKRIKKREYPDDISIEDIEETNVIFLLSSDEMYAMVIVEERKAPTDPLIPVRLLHRFKPPVKYSLVRGEEPYPISSVNPQSLRDKKFLRAIFDYDPDLLQRITQSIKTGEPVTSNTQPHAMIESNTIFYGPPGTGKTYRLQQLINEWQLVERLPAVTKNFAPFVIGYHWWQLIGLALFEKKEATVPELLEHDLIKTKFAISNIQHPPQRLWSTLQNHTVLNCPHVKGENRSGELLFYKELPSKWRLANPADFSAQFPYLIEDWKNFMNKHEEVSISKNYLFTTCHQSLSYEDFIEGIKPVLNEEKDDNSQPLQYEVRKGIFYQACEKAAERAGFRNLNAAIESTREERSEKFQQALNQKKYYTVFLDEINRCNIAAVFGELITLIEPDKRLGAVNEIADTTLPYSQTKFGVPANLLIVGSMNTADRSVEALDTALRRRFCFIEKGVDLSMLKKTPAGIDLAALLSAINKRLIVLLSKDQVIGHAWLMNADTLEKLQHAFKHKIIPLLQEFFYHDHAKIGLVLGDAFVQQTSENKNVFAPFKNSSDIADDYSDKVIYLLKDPMELSGADFKSVYQ